MTLSWYWAVSYTHLDVYKRQFFFFFFSFFFFFLQRLDDIDCSDERSQVISSRRSLPFELIKPCSNERPLDIPHRSRYSPIFSPSEGICVYRVHSAETSSPKLEFCSYLFVSLLYKTVVVTPGAGASQSESTSRADRIAAVSYTHLSFACTERLPHTRTPKYSRDGQSHEPDDEMGRDGFIDTNLS